MTPTASVLASVLAAASLAPLPTEPPAGQPDAVVDLATAEGASAVKGQWRYGDTRIVEVEFRGPGSDNQPSGPPNRTWDVVPHAGPADFDDSSWPVIENPLVVAIGLGGPEVGFPRADFAPWFARARAAGYDAVAHAGETAGAEHVRQAVLDLGARRVQHGVRAVEDEAVLRLLAEQRICCDLALASNQCLKVVSELKDHPLRRMMAAGVPVTLSTDDPPFFGTDLNREYERAHQELGLSAAVIWELNFNGLRHALAETGVRRRLLKEFEAARQALGVAG